MALFKTLGLLTALLACHSVALCQVHEDPTEPITSALRAREFDKAVELTRSALDPHQSLSTAAQGLAAVQANDLDHALASIQSKLERKPNDALLLYLQADLLAQKSADVGAPEFQLAMRSAKRAVSPQPTLGAARGVLAKLYMQAGQYPEAIEQCREALKSDPKDQTALYRLIQALRKKLIEDPAAGRPAQP